MTIIYMAVNIINDSVYIGKTNNTLEWRVRKHYYDALSENKKYKTHFHHAIRKHGKDSFEWNILEEVQNTDANNAEIFWIAYYKYIGISLYNKTLGGDGLSKGYIPSLETRQKLSKAASNRIFSEKDRNKISKALEKTYTFISPTNEVMVITGLQRYCKQNGLSNSHMNRVAHGKQKQHKGWKKYNIAE